MKVFITKYALSFGIKEDEAYREPDEDGYIWTGEPGRMSSQMFTHSEWFETRDLAVADAENRRVKKIASLKKQIAKLEKLTFA